MFYKFLFDRTGENML